MEQEKSAAVRETIGEHDVVLYTNSSTTPGCGFCERAKRLLEGEQQQVVELEGTRAALVSVTGVAIASFPFVFVRGT